MEDENIVRLFLNRDETAIDRTAEKYGRRLRALSFGITADEQTAEECESDTYFEAWRRIPPAEPTTYLYPFLARIARHISIDRCRSRAAAAGRSGIVVELTEELADCLPAGEDTESIADARLLGETVNRFLLTLPKEKRVMFVRRYFCMDTVAEISSRLSTGESRVKTALFRIRAEFRRYLIREGYDL